MDPESGVVGSNHGLNVCASSTFIDLMKFFPLISTLLNNCYPSSLLVCSSLLKLRLLLMLLMIIFLFLNIAVCTMNLLVPLVICLSDLYTPNCDDLLLRIIVFPDPKYNCCICCTPNSTNSFLSFCFIILFKNFRLSSNLHTEAIFVRDFNADHKDWLYSFITDPVSDMVHTLTIISYLEQLTQHRTQHIFLISTLTLLICGTWSLLVN